MSTIFCINGRGVAVFKCGYSSINLSCGWPAWLACVSVYVAQRRGAALSLACAEKRNSGAAYGGATNAGSVAAGWRTTTGALLGSRSRQRSALQWRQPKNKAAAAALAETTASLNYGMMVCAGEAFGCVL